MAGRQQQVGEERQEERKEGRKEKKRGSCFENRTGTGGIEVVEDRGAFVQGAVSRVDIAACFGGL